MRRMGMVLLLWGVLAGLAAGQFGDKMKMGSSATAKYMAVPGLPSCAVLSVENGDPGKGAFTGLAKVGPGCVIPWHWHSANESLMFVSGRAKVEMKGTPASPLGPGDYAYLPAKQPHLFTCLSTCAFFLSSDAKFDIHYIDAAGKEIPPEQALRKPGKPAGKGGGK